MDNECKEFGDYKSGFLFSDQKNVSRDALYLEIREIETSNMAPSNVSDIISLSSCIPRKLYTTYKLSLQLQIPIFVSRDRRQ